MNKNEPSTNSSVADITFLKRSLSPPITPTDGLLPKARQCTNRAIVCVHKRYTQRSEDFLLFLGLAAGLSFPSQYQYFWAEITGNKRWHDICRQYMRESA